MVEDEQQIESRPLVAYVAVIGGAGQTGAAEFEEVVREHFTSLHRAAFRLTHDWGAAEDLVQDTLERAYRAFDRYRPEGKARAWLGCIMRNLWIYDHRRRRGAPHTLPLDFPQAELPTHGAVDALSAADAEAVVLDELGVASILRAIDDLPSHLRQIVVLADVRDLPHGTIAQMLAVPIGTVASRLSRGRRHPRAALHEQARGAGLLARAS
jgi:RNA polymerase sigma-70 factor (ECF subfamily)